MTCTSKPTVLPVIFDKKAIFQSRLQHLIELAQTPGWKAYVWHKAKELDAETSGLFKGIADALKAAMTGQAKNGVLERQNKTKPP